MKKYFKKHFMLLSFLLCILLGLCIVIPNWIAGGGIYHIMGDFDYQQIPFNMYMNSALKSGSLSFTWNNGLGSNFIGTFSFYNLFSPFSMIGYIFPSKFFPYLVGFLFVLKYGFAGLFAHLFMKRYVKNEKYIVLGALLYAFSGFQLTNVLYYHFHDVVVFFPLLLYSLDCLVYENKGKLFGFSILICALTNWFFFIGEGIFLFIYFIVKVVTKYYVINKKVFFKLFIESVCGVGMACFVLIPVFLFTLSNPRIGTGWTFMDAIKYPFHNYLEIVRGMFFYPDTMTNRSLISPGNYDSVELYLPVVGLILAFSYCVKKPKSSLSILLYLSVLFMFVPILNNSFILFNTHYYARWFFMPILFFVLSSVKTLDEGYSIKSGVCFTIEGILFFIIGLILYHFKWGLYVENIYYIVLVGFFTLLGIVFTGIVYRFFTKKFLMLCILAVFISVGFFGNLMIYKYKGNTFSSFQSYELFIKKNNLLQSLKNTRSYSDNTCPANLSLFQSIQDLHSFNSNLSGGEFSFLQSVGVDRETSTMIEDDTILSFLGVQYFISCDYQDRAVFKIQENPEALSFGFVPTKYISDDDYLQLDVSKRISLLKDTVVLNSKQIEEYQDFILSSSEPHNSSYQYLKNGFHYQATFERPSFLVFQIPYDSGWDATINGENVSLEKVDNGLMGIKTTKGENLIELSYHPPGLVFGIIISIVSFLTFFGYCIKQ